MNTYVIVGNQSTNKIVRNMWLEVLDNENVIYLEDTWRYRGILALWIHKHIRNTKVRFLSTILNLRQYWLDFVPHERLTRAVLIFNTMSIQKHDTGYLYALKQKYGLRYVLVVYDPIKSGLSSTDDIEDFLNEKGIDLVFSFDTEDCSRYHFQNFTQIYSKISSTDSDSLIKYDLYFAGRDKGRLVLINEIWKKLRQYDVKMMFRLSNIPNAKQISDNSLSYHDMVPYEDIVRQVHESNCLLEILQPGQSGITWRTLEAVCYNKKLLTNNKQIVNFKYYDPRYMKVIESSSDIDPEWIKKREIIDYQYAGDFSPKQMLEKIDKHILKDVP